MGNYIARQDRNRSKNLSWFSLIVVIYSLIPHANDCHGIFIYRCGCTNLNNDNIHTGWEESSL